jgi:hypothetical protein
MFGDNSLKMTAAKKSMKDHIDRDYNTYVLNLVEREQTEHNPFTSARLKVLLRQSSGNS